MMKIKKYLLLILLLLPLTIAAQIKSNRIIGSASSGTGDQWGSQVAITDTTLNGNGTVGSPLSVDTVTVIATKSDVAAASDGNGLFDAVNEGGTTAISGYSLGSDLTVTQNATNITYDADVAAYAAIIDNANTGGSGLRIYSNGGNAIRLEVLAGAGAGASIVTGSGVGVNVTSTGGTAINATSNAAGIEGVIARSTVVAGLGAISDVASTDAAHTVANFKRTTTGTAASGIGNRLAFFNEMSDFSQDTVGQMTFTSTDVATSTHDGDFDLGTSTNGAITSKFKALSDGSIEFPNYGDGVISGTATYGLGVTADGKIVHTNAAALPGTYEEGVKASVTGDTISMDVIGLTLDNASDNDSDFMAYYDVATSEHLRLAISEIRYGQWVLNEEGVVTTAAITRNDNVTFADGAGIDNEINMGSQTITTGLVARSQFLEDGADAAPTTDTLFACSSYAIFLKLNSGTAASNGTVTLPTPSELLTHVVIVISAQDADGTYDTEVTGGANNLYEQGALTTTRTVANNETVTIRILRTDATATGWKWGITSAY